MGDLERINVDQPLWDQSTFYGRFRHFAWKTDPRNVFHLPETLYDAKELVDKYRKGEEPPGVTEAQVKQAMKLCAASFHPDTGHLQNVLGRMSCQVPVSMVINGAMLQYYYSTPLVIFWQWFNQSFNAMVNCSNRNAGHPLTMKQLGVAYVSATASALTTAVGLKTILEKRASPIFLRIVPFVAVATANAVNVPLMRQNEIFDGVYLQDEQGRVLVTSKSAAIDGITKVVISRNVITSPAMLLLPLFMERMERTKFLMKYTRLVAPLQVFGVGICFGIMTPIGCALFPQMNPVSVEKLRQKEPQKYLELKEKCAKLQIKVPNTLYFNKGL